MFSEQIGVYVPLAAVEISLRGADVLGVKLLLFFGVIGLEQ